ncbi:hypothetical protein ACFV3F_20090 [Streptomyces sp. NPDC059717]|uniref:hypothetical protein n=1 Tax=Streptomyces sp. NPDC059717 TaxID=3346922 RepID=UPI0036CC7622
MTEATDTAPVWGRASLPLPGVGDLSKEQQRGAACVWCKTHLTAESAVDLGERRIRPLAAATRVLAMPRYAPCTITPPAAYAASRTPAVATSAWHCDV